MKIGAISLVVVILVATEIRAEDYFKPLDKMALTPTELKWIYNYAPLVIEWVEEVEVRQLAEGRELTDSEFVLARSMSVNNPENIRVIVTSDFPVPLNRDLSDALRIYDFDPLDSAGMALGYAVFIKPEYEGDTALLAHEFVHVAQAESVGLRPFLVTYLAGLKMYGYFESPLETEARTEVWRLLNGSD
ncbi:MAG: hypothetical protein ABJ000_08330 [Saccharospirillum sp.]|uniref:hypothetical protein n=1 Tax=Saccharospirillum sp. TaxID=2033801 RepID=UPI003297B74E